MKLIPLKYITRATDHEKRTFTKVLHCEVHPSHTANDDHYFMPWVVFTFASMAAIVNGSHMGGFFVDFFAKHCSVTKK